MEARVRQYLDLMKKILDEGQVREDRTGTDERALTEPIGSAQRRCIKFDGLNLHVGEWSRRMGIQSATIIRRLNAGWSARDALTKQPRVW